MEILILGLIIGGLLLWLLNDFRKYKKKNNHLILIMLLSAGSLCAHPVIHVPFWADTEAAMPVENDTGVARTVFGRNIFATKNLSFEPNMNLATPGDYVLGTGDEVVISVWGASENTIRQTISPEGNIMVSNIGPVYLSGLNVNEANLFLQQKFSKIYGGVPDKEFSLKLTLGQARSIQINVMGEVAVPGTYILSSFASVFHALYRAGGVSPIGSLRKYNWCVTGRK